MREDGFYWVKCNSEWVVCEWRYNSWWMPMHGINFSDNDFEEIDERQIKRDE